MRKIMVHLTGKASDEVALETAIAVAKRFDGHIDGLLVAANVREDLRPLPPLEFCRGTTKLGVRLSGRRGQRMRELAAIFQRQHGLDALRMAQVRRVGVHRNLKVSGSGMQLPASCGSFYHPS
jgi:nucleotide-binding universal stress UspA family protein